MTWTEEYQADLIRGYLEVAARKECVAGMQVWNFADFAVVQSTGRVGGLNLKGVFTRTRTPKLAAHVLREFWVKPAEMARRDAAPSLQAPAGSPAGSAGPARTEPRRRSRPSACPPLQG